ncbi:MAG: IS110 family transposase [Saccharofermentans sp.]|nr:IS110 family transposase [Saccharofermentans sp.]
MSNTTRFSVGIDISKGKSIVAVINPFGDIVKSPFEIRHTSSDLKKLTGLLKSLDGETRIVMEYTGTYYQPVARLLSESGLFVSVVHAKILHDFTNNSIRRIKTDKADAVKIANYGLLHWDSLKCYSIEDDTRLLLKSANRQYYYFLKQYVAAKNNLIAVIDQTCPGLNDLFTSPRREDGHIKWVDVAIRFWHCEYITGFSLNKFTELYNDWCKKNKYIGSNSKAEELYQMAKECVPTLPKNESTRYIVRQAAEHLLTLSETLGALQKEMVYLAEQLPEYPIVMSFTGVGRILGPQLMAEIGDVRRFYKRSCLIAFAGVDAPPFQSGKFDSKNRHISKKGSCELRKTLFQVVTVLLQNTLVYDPVYQFIDRKRQEGKPYYVYMVAGCNKFLRIYYARVKEYLAAQEAA